MKVVSLLILVLLMTWFESTPCYEIMVGSFKKDSFAKNDAKINGALNLVKSEITNRYNSQNISIMPVAIYSQIVNGINYKIIVAIKDKSTEKVDLVQTIVYTGPFSVNYAQENLYLSFYQKLPNDNSNNLNETEVIAMNLVISEYTKKSGNSLLNVNTIISYPNLNYGESFYIVHASVSNSTGTRENKIFIMNYTKNNEFIVTNAIDK